jgi:replicative DNA helicase
MNTLPDDLLVEKTVLGQIIEGGLLASAKYLSPDDFSDQGHRTVFEAMQEIDEAGETIGLITLLDHLKNKGFLSGQAGTYLTDLKDQADKTTPALMPTSVKIIKEMAVKRRIIEISKETATGLNNADLTQIISDLGACVEGLALSPTLENIGFFDMDKLYIEAKAYADKGKETGIAELDKVVKIMPKELIIITARVRHGKSSFAYNLLLNFIEKYENEAFIFFNLDVPSTIAMTRVATIWAKKHRQKSLGYKDILPCFQHINFMPPEITDAFSNFDFYGHKKRFAMVNTPNYTVEQLIGHAERLAKERPLGAIFVDYIELLKTSKKTASEELRLAHIVNSLRIASEKLSCPIIALAQMNRDSAKEKTVAKRRPALEGLRYSGRQEQEATTVLGLFNVSQEKIDIDNEDGQMNEPQSEAVLEAIALKNRGGQSNRIIELSFDMVSGHINSREKISFAR